MATTTGWRHGSTWARSSPVRGRRALLTRVLLLAVVLAGVAGVAGTGGCAGGARPTAAAPAPASVAATSAGPASAPSSMPAPGGGDIVAVPPWLKDDSHRARTAAFRREIRRGVPLMERCRQRDLRARSACLCDALCTLRFPPLPGGQGSTEVRYPELRGAPISRWSFRVKGDGHVESCRFSFGTAPGAGYSRHTVVHWCEDVVGGP